MRGRQGAWLMDLDLGWINWARCLPRGLDEAAAAGEGCYRRSKRKWFNLP